MKQLAKKLLVFVLALTVACTAAAPVTAEAAVSLAKKQTLYRASNSGITYSSGFYVGNLSKSATIKSVKSSKKSVAAPAYVDYSGYATSYLESSLKPYNYSSYSASIGLKLLNKGTTTVSFKIGSKSYSTNVTVKNYVNPIKTANIAGIKNGSSTNLKSKTAKQNTARLKLSKDKKGAVVSITAASGWKIGSLEVEDTVTGSTYSIKNYSKGVSKASLNVGTLKKNKKVSVKVTLYNTKDNGAIAVTYYINK